MSKLLNPKIIADLKDKAAQSPCTYRIAAIAFDKKGDVLGHISNNHSSWDVIEKENGIGRAGTGKHAERLLIGRYGKNIKSMLIARIGRSGDLKPISPCKACQKAADKLGIKIHTVDDFS